MTRLERALDNTNAVTYGDSAAIREFIHKAVKRFVGDDAPDVMIDE